MDAPHRHASTRPLRMEGTSHLLALILFIFASLLLLQPSAVAQNLLGTWTSGGTESVVDVILYQNDAFLLCAHAGTSNVIVQRHTANGSIAATYSGHTGAIADATVCGDVLFSASADGTPGT